MRGAGLDKETLGVITAKKKAKVSKESKSWTSREIEKAWRLKNKGKPNREIGLALGRTAASVHYIVGKTHDYMG